MALVHNTQRWMDVLNSQISDAGTRAAMRNLVRNLEQFSIEVVEGVNGAGGGGGGGGLTNHQILKRTLGS